jgi:regulatory protein
MSVEQKMSLEKALTKLQKFCAYQERCQEEARSKLLEFGIYGEKLDSIIAELIADDFINEERFAQTFARGKFKIKKWGKNRIIQELKFRKISDYCIKKALKEVDDHLYIETLSKILNEKLTQWNDLHEIEKKYKSAQYALMRGYESELIWKLLNEKENF